VDTARRREGGFAKNPGHQGRCYSECGQGVAHRNCRRSSPPQLNDIDGRGCRSMLTANAMQLEAGKKQTELPAPQGPMAAAFRCCRPIRSKAATALLPDERPAHLLCPAALLGGLALKLRSRSSRQGCASDDAAAAARHQPEHQTGDRFVDNEGIGAFPPALVPNPPFASIFSNGRPRSASRARWSVSPNHSETPGPFVRASSEVPALTMLQ
jgi:hypothetical protein